MSEELKISTDIKEYSSTIMDESFYSYPTAYIAGHGNIKFSQNEAERLRKYLISGGFLFADDDFGMDPFFRREMKKVFPELKFITNAEADAGKKTNKNKLSNIFIFTGYPSHNSIIEFG